MGVISFEEGLAQIVDGRTLPLSEFSSVSPAEPIQTRLPFGIRFQKHGQTYTVDICPYGVPNAPKQTTASSHLSCIRSSRLQSETLKSQNHGLSRPQGFSAAKYPFVIRFACL